MSQLRLKYLFLLLISSLFIKMCLTMDKGEEDMNDQLEHAQSFLESFLAGTADSMFSDQNMFSRFKVKKEDDTDIIDHDTTKDARDDITNEADIMKDNSANNIKLEDVHKAKVKSNSEEESQSITEPSETKTEPSFNYHQVFRENYHNVNLKQKVETQGDVVSEDVNMELESTQKSSKKYDNINEIADKVFNMNTISIEQVIGTTASNETKQEIGTAVVTTDYPHVALKEEIGTSTDGETEQEIDAVFNSEPVQKNGTTDHDITNGNNGTTENVEIKQESGNKSNTVKQDIGTTPHVALKQEIGTSSNYESKKEIGTSAYDESKQEIGTNSYNESEQKISSNNHDIKNQDIGTTAKDITKQESVTSDDLSEERAGREYSAVETKDYGPIDRSINDDYIHDINAKDFFQGNQPFPLRDKDYFNSYFEISPSYDLRSSSFLREPSETGFGEKTVKQVVYSENRIKKRKDKHIFGGVIGGLAGVFGFLAGKKLIFTFVGIATLLAMGITGTQPWNMFENLIDISTDMSFEATYDGQGNPTGSTVGVGVGKEGRSASNDRIYSYSNLRKPMAKLYNYLENSTISAVEPVVNTLEEFGEIWTHFTKGFSTALDLENLEDSVREQRDGLWSMFPEELSTGKEYTAAALSSIKTATEYVQDTINDVVSVLYEGDKKEGSGVETIKLLESEAIINTDVSESLPLMTADESLPLMTADESLPLMTADESSEQRFQKSFKFLKDDSEEEIDPEEEPESNELEEALDKKKKRRKKHIGMGVVG